MAGMLPTAVTHVHCPYYARYTDLMLFVKSTSSPVGVTIVVLQDVAFVRCPQVSRLFVAIQLCFWRTPVVLAVLLQTFAGSVALYCQA